ncbi:MAG: HK97 family phage prohead protease [Planctomycetota bacterium]
MIVNPRPPEMLLIDPAYAGRWPRRRPLFDPERHAALQKAAQEGAEARRREQENVLRDLELGAKLHRDCVLQEAEAQLQRSRRGNPALEMLRDEERRIEKDKRTKERQRRRAEATDRYRTVRARARRTLGLKVFGHVPYGKWMQAVGKNGEPRWTTLAPGAFDNSIKNRLRIDPPIHLEVDHDEYPVNLVSDLTILPTKHGLFFRTRIAHDDPALWRIRKMREISPRYLTLKAETDQYVHPDDWGEQDHVKEAVLLELSFVEKSSNPDSWFYLEEREGAAA